MKSENRLAMMTQKGGTVEVAANSVAVSSGATVVSAEVVVVVDVDEVDDDNVDVVDVKEVDDVVMVVAVVDVGKRSRALPRRHGAAIGDVPLYATPGNGVDLHANGGRPYPKIKTISHFVLQLSLELQKTR